VAYVFDKLFSVFCGRDLIMGLSPIQEILLLVKSILCLKIRTEQTAMHGNLKE
jgi:hypothetical protein